MNIKLPFTHQRLDGFGLFVIFSLNEESSLTSQLVQLHFGEPDSEQEGFVDLAFTVPAGPSQYIIASRKFD